MKFSRRSFLTGTTLAAPVLTSGLVAPHVSRSAEALLRSPGQKPKKIIHVVSDGMSLGTLTTADLFSRQQQKRALSWVNFTCREGITAGLMNTRSLNSLVTDSAAASSAWGSGSRVMNGVLNWLPDGRELLPLYTLFQQKGWKTGLVSSAEITHATPAGFAVTAKSRSTGEQIALSYLKRGVDVLLGGGSAHFSPKLRKDKQDVWAEFIAAGYAFANDLPSLLRAPTDKKLIGTFADGHLPYTVDQRLSERYKNSPTLAQLTQAALERLGNHEHFILQVEGARIDHAAHNSDAAAAVWDQLALDEALDAVLAYQAKNPDTLVVITTDHGNSNLGINGEGSNYDETSQRFAFLAEVKMSYPEILKRIEKAGTKIKVTPPAKDAEDILPKKTPSKPAAFTGATATEAVEVAPLILREIVAETTGYKMSERRAGLFAQVLAGKYRPLYDQMDLAVTQFGQVMANRLGVGWTGRNHTADYVPLHAFGPGAELFGGFLENTDVFRKYTALAGIDYQNPSVPLIAGGPSAEAVELGDWC